MKKIFDKWIELAHKIGNFNARVILSIFYFLFITPFALYIKIFKDPLKLKKRNQWIEKKWVKPDILEARRQF
ncbi:MAG: hypothetical protein AB1397_05090 [bacterium]